MHRSGRVVVGTVIAITGVLSIHCAPGLSTVPRTYCAIPSRSPCSVMSASRSIAGVRHDGRGARAGDLGGLLAIRLTPHATIVGIPHAPTRTLATPTITTRT